MLAAVRRGVLDCCVDVSSELMNQIRSDSGSGLGLARSTIQVSSYKGKFQ